MATRFIALLNIFEHLICAKPLYKCIQYFNRIVLYLREWKVNN